MTVVETAPDVQVRRLSAEQVAHEANASQHLVDELVKAGAIHQAIDGTHEEDDVSRVHLAHALTSGGIAVEDLINEIREGRILLDQAPRMHQAPESSGRTFEEFSAGLGGAAGRLPAIYAAFGLGLPPPDTTIGRDEAETITDFLQFWAMVEDRPDAALRHAWIMGEGVRHLVTASLDLFDEMGGSPPPRLRRGLTVDEAIRPTVQMPATMNRLLTWLRDRHTAHEVFGRIVTYLEGSLASSGRMPVRAIDPPAVAFVDLTGYTARTAERGDEWAARNATTLQTLAQAAASAHAGRVVKLLGDGVMLRFASARDAIVAVRELMASIAAQDLPVAHAGIATGPLVDRDGDVYGHTVNLAARIASVSAGGELLVEHDVAEALAGSGVEWTDAGTTTLKGVPGAVHLVRIVV